MSFPGQAKEELVSADFKESESSTLLGLCGCETQGLCPVAQNTKIQETEARFLHSKVSCEDLLTKTTKASY